MLEIWSLWVTTFQRWNRYRRPAGPVRISDQLVTGTGRQKFRLVPSLLHSAMKRKYCCIKWKYLVFAYKIYFRQLCDLGFLSLLSTETGDNTSDATPLFQSDMIDNGLVNFTHFLNYIRKHTDRLIIRAGRRTWILLFFFYIIILVSILQRSHEVCLDLFNDSAFDMAR